MEYNDFVKEWFNGEDFIRVHTSGSTGEPKVISLLKSDMIRSALATVEQFGLDSSSVIASLLPMSSIATRMAVVRSIVAGCRYIDLLPSNNFTLPEHIDLLSVGPSQTDCLINNPAMSRLTRFVMVGGAPLSTERRDSLTAAGYDLWESYGMTETCSNVALRHAPSSLFTANTGISLSIDERSCLTIHAPDYDFDNITTNDIVELVTPTSFRWLGRFDNVINSGGIKIFPEKLEAELAPHLKIPFYITSVPDPKWGEAVVLVVEGYSPEVDQAIEAIAKVSDPRHRPHYIAAEPHFTHTPTGKIKRTKPTKFAYHK